MKLSYVQFIHPVSFGGQLQSASNRAVGDRPGQGNMEIELGVLEGVSCISLSKLVNGVPATRLVPLSNVAMFEAAEVEVSKAPAKK